MAIVSFVLLAIIGLMPTSLTELNEAERRAAEARILQSINDEYGLKPWKILEAQSAPVILYFRANGAVIDPEGQKDYAALGEEEKREVRYAALVEPAPAQSQNATSGKLMVPGEGTPGGYLRCMRVAITSSVSNARAILSARMPRGTEDYKDPYRHLRRECAIVLINREPDNLTGEQP